VAFSFISRRENMSDDALRFETLAINGRQVYVVDEQFIEYVANPVEVLPGRYVERPGFNHAMRVAFPGLVYDLAVPQGWLDSDQQAAEKFTRVGAVWTYSERSVFGEPLYGDAILEKYVEMVQSRLKEVPCGKAA